MPWLMLLGFLAGLRRPGGEWFISGLIGVSIMSIFWIPVLWTNRKS